MSYYRKRLIESEIKTLSKLKPIYEAELMAAVLSDAHGEAETSSRALKEIEIKLERLTASYNLLSLEGGKNEHEF